MTIYCVGMFHCYHVLAIVYCYIPHPIPCSVYCVII